MCHFHEKAVSFLCNVVALRPNSRDPIHRTNPRARRLRKSGKATAPGLGERVYKEEASLYDVASMSAFHSGEGSRHKVLRSSVKIQRTVTGQLIIAEKKHIPESYEDEDRDLEDLGEARSMINEGVKPSKFSQYHPVSQPLGLIESVAANILPTVDEGPELALVDMPEAVQGYPCRGDLMPSYSPRLLSAGPPSIQVTLASLWTPHSPIFRRHSPITVTKYLQATSPQLASSMMRSGASSGRVASTCPLPSVRSCDRQVEDDIVCWACERRWLACKMWYQANDEGLMEPFMRRAESNADLRAVLEFLSVPREDERAGRIGLGSDLPSADTIKKRPPFRVVDPSPVNSGSDCDCPPAGKRFLLFGSRSWRHLRSIFMEARRESRDAVRAWVAASLGPLSPLCRSDEPKLRRRSGGLSAVSTSPLAVHHGLAAIWANCDRPCLSQLSPAYGSQFFGSADNASGSRFMKHLV